MRVHRCFAFVDLSGFTALTEIEGDERAVTVLNAFRTLARDICSRRGVRIAKWLGDGAMLVNLETRPVVDAALEMQVAVANAPVPIAVRCGIASGDVILYEGDDYIGHCVNVAARLSDLAVGGEVLAAPEVLPAIAPWASVLETGEVPLRGLERPLTVSHLGLRPLAGAGEPDPVCGILLDRHGAVETLVDAVGREVWFCSDSCRDTWEHRPAPPPEELGSLRGPLIG